MCVSRPLAKDLETGESEELFFAGFWDFSIFGNSY